MAKGRREGKSRLNELWEKREPKVSQAEFGAAHGIGGQAMVWQYLSGKRSLGDEAAAKFARGLRCTIRDIDPDLATSIKEKVDRVNEQVLPVLGGEGGDKRKPRPTDRTQERLTEDERQLLQTYRRLRELGDGGLLLRTAKSFLDHALEGRTGADVEALMRQQPRKKR